MYVHICIQNVCRQVCYEVLNKKRKGIRFVRRTKIILYFIVLNLFSFLLVFFSCFIVQCICIWVVIVSMMFVMENHLDLGARNIDQKPNSSIQNTSVHTSLTNVLLGGCGRQLIFSSISLYVFLFDMFAFTINEKKINFLSMNCC